ncbi:hypothetical protein [Streptomyces hydrogenans]
MTKRKKPPRRQQRGPKATAKHQLGPVRFRDHTDSAAKILSNAKPEQLVEVTLPYLFASIQAGDAANVCVSSSLVLQRAYAMFGIRSELLPVSIGSAPMDRPITTASITTYGTDHPRWVGDQLHGHCVLHLPDSDRFVDVTADQFPDIAREGLGPIVGAGLHPGAAQTTGAMIAVQRGNRLIVYTPAAPMYQDLILNHPTVQANLPLAHSAGVKLASLALNAFRAPFVIERARATPHPRLHKLLDLVADAPMGSQEGTPETSSLWFEIPTADGTTTRRQLDELLPLP